jgi:hypothetical protein
VTALHVAVTIFCVLVVFVGLAVIFLGVCAALGSERKPTPQVPADVDLAQCLATTKAIDDAGRPYPKGRLR